MNRLLEIARGVPAAPLVLAAGALALAAVTFALTRRHAGESALGYVAAATGLALVLLAHGRADLGLGLLWVAVTTATGVALAAHAGRLGPVTPPAAAGNEQRVLALLLVALLGGAWAVAGRAVDWEPADARTISTLVVGGTVVGAGLVGVLTRRLWLHLALAGQWTAFGLTLLAVGVPGRAAAPFAPALLAWAWAAGVAGVALALAAARRGAGPAVEALEEGAP